MSNNISKDYVSFAQKNISEYMKLMMNKKFNKEIFDILNDTYIKVRYYNFYESKHKNFQSNINYYLKEKTIELMKTDNLDNKKTAENTYLLFKYILYFDDVLEYTSLTDIVKEIEDFQIKELDIYDENFTKELTELIKSNKKRKKTFLETIDNDKLKLSLTKTNNKSVYFADLTYDITFPKIYSEYSINKVYHTAIVNEDKLFITYHLLSKLILENAINGIYDIQYIVDFPLTIFEKKEKINRLFNTIDNDIVRDNVIINFTYTDYLAHKEEIEDLIKQGYKFAIQLDDKFNYQEDSKIWLDIFTYIIVFDDITYDFDQSKIIIKK